MKIISVIGEAMFIFGLISWFYTIVISFFREHWLKMPLTHLTLWLRTDVYGIISFIVAIAGFLIWRII